MSADDFDDVETVLAPKVDRPGTAGSTFRLTVIDGADKGKSFVIGPGQAQRVLVGQSPACELKLADRLVSRRHVAVEMMGARLRLCDLASTNGTLVQGLAVMDAYLTGGEEVRVGGTTIRVELISHGEEVRLTSAGRFGKIVGQSPE